MEEKRIAIVGYSGSGKSTLAGKLGQFYKCEVVHLDRVYWLPGWREREQAEMEEIVTEFLDTHKSWIIDGNYQSACYDRRMGEATGIIFLVFPRRICLYRVIRRFLSNRGKSRDSMAEGCEEKIDWEFLWWILYRGRDRGHRENYRRLVKTYQDKTVVLSSPWDVERFLSKLA